MIEKANLGFESPVTNGALERLLISVHYFHVLSKICLEMICLAAIRASERCLATVYCKVVLQTSFVLEDLVTLFAFKWLLSRVCYNVLGQTVLSLESPVAVGVLELLFFFVPSEMTCPTTLGLKD